jgi:hypothetical protein
MIEPERPQLKIQHMGVACWIIRATGRHLDYVILLFSRQQWLRERASLSRYRYIAYSFWEIKALFYTLCFKIKVFCVVRFSRSADYEYADIMYTAQKLGILSSRHVLTGRINCIFFMSTVLGTSEFSASLYFSFYLQLVGVFAALKFSIVNKRCSSPKSLHPQHQRLSASDTRCSFCSFSLTKSHWLSLYYFHVSKFNGPDAFFHKVSWYFLSVTWRKGSQRHFIWGTFPFRIRSVCK